jgi:Ca2+-binding EF-hand superfamily protein
LDRDELTALLRCCDKGQKGYIASGKFIEQLYALASESEGDVILRRLAKTLSHSDTNLRQEMQRYDTTGNGKLDKQTFKKCLKQLSIALTDSEIQKLMPAPSEGAATASKSKQSDQE